MRWSSWLLPIIAKSPQFRVKVVLWLYYHRLHWVKGGELKMTRTMVSASFGFYFRVCLFRAVLLKLIRTEESLISPNPLPAPLFCGRC